MPFNLPLAAPEMTVMDRSQTSVCQQGCEVERPAPGPYRGTAGTCGTITSWLCARVCKCMCILLYDEVEKMLLD